MSPSKRNETSSTGRAPNHLVLTGSVISTCISTILRELELSCEPAFSAILKTPWMHLENVSGRSAYIVDLVGSVKQVAEMVRSRIESKRFIRNLADKAVG